MTCDFISPASRNIPRRHLGEGGKGVQDKKGKKSLSSVYCLVAHVNVVRVSKGHEIKKFDAHQFS